MKRITSAFAAILLPLLVLAVFAFGAAAQEKAYDVPYVPTRDDVLDVMLGMAEVTPNDVVYDLGCGDGRIVIAAALRYGARGVGIDINPERIRESNDNAAKAGVTGRVRFIVQNLFSADIRDATVVAFYLLPQINLKLRPILFNQLRPGVRVVSHNYDMGAWAADESQEVTTNYTSHTVYSWVIPANVSGTWKMTVKGPSWKGDYTLNLDQSFQKVKGAAASGSASLRIEEFTLTGPSATFSLGGVQQGYVFPIRFTGRANGDTMEGTVIISAGARKGTFPWKAVRIPGTMKPVDIQ